MQALEYWKTVTNRPSKRQKDLADIARLLEARPELRKASARRRTRPAALNRDLSLYKRTYSIQNG